jgi:hypothetical protein
MKDGSAEIEDFNVDLNNSVNINEDRSNEL